MLILERKKGEEILIGNDVIVAYNFHELPKVY